MPNQIDANGIQTKSLADVIADLTAAFQSIYGTDINVDSNSPDGQLIGVFAQMIVDGLDLDAQIYAMFDPDQAIGTTLDARLALNGIRRQGGTYTLTEIYVTVDRALNLQGLDADINNPDGTGYTVSDGAGNQWILENTATLGAAGTYILTFRSKVIGAVLTTINTITTPVSIVVGVTAVNNPNPSLSIGEDQETDADVKIRRRKSVAIPSSGYFEGLLAGLLNIPGVDFANLYENTGDVTDGDGIPGHGIWAIVEGGANADIAQVIYAKRNAGVSMKGSVTYPVPRPNGSTFTVAWDVVATQTLYIKFTLAALDGGATPNAAAIKTALAAQLKPAVFQAVDVNEVAALVREINANALITFPAGQGISTDNANFFSSRFPNAKNKKFTLVVGNITIV